MPRVKTPQPPKHLKPATRAWFKSVIADYDLEPHDIRILTLACEAWDRCEQARRELGKDGLTVPTANGLKAHPCVAIERDSRIAFARLVRELALDAVDPPAGSRPPALRGYAGRA